MKKKKIVLQKSSEKFLAQVQRSNEIFEQHLKQLDIIKTRLYDVLAASNSNNADEEFGKICNIQEELLKLSNIPFILRR